MSAVLPVEVCEGRLDRIGADVLVAPFFESHRPLRGPVAHVDWRLSGLLSAELAAGRISGARGEATLLISAGRLQVPSIIAFGLGPKPGFSERDLEELAGDLVRRVVALRAGRVAIALPDELVMGFPIELTSEAVVRGAAAALHEQPAALHLRLLCGSRGRDAERGVRTAASRAPVPVRLGAAGPAPGQEPEGESVDRLRPLAVSASGISPTR
ncbi:MAG: hypothetical protein JRH01_08255 [Deltaproteobacteria bacterium]|nr:hypothetical protein [Deltaproteobacteria bacterium]MBW2394927.1 hypothetical protein [Deltaproteobacteria bacterium]